MKIVSLEIVNVGLIEKEKIAFDLPLILFYGGIMAGKTTILNSVKWVLGAPWPEDLIRHGEKEASITLELDCGMIGRSWYKGKNGETKARDITFIMNGRPVGRPATEIARFLNPFLLDQNFLIKMGEAERKKYFAELFAVDTTAIDTELFKREREAQEVRAEVRGYGDIDLTPVPPDDTLSLKAKLEELRGLHAAQPRKWSEEIDKLTAEHQAACDKVDEENEEIRKNNTNWYNTSSNIAQATDTIKDLEAKLAAAKQELERFKRFHQEHPLLTLKERPKPPAEIAELKGRMMAHPVTTDEIRAVEAQMSTASANAARRQQLEKNQARARERDSKQARLSGLEARIKELRGEKVKKLKDITATCPVKELAFEEDGTFTYQGTQAGMLSTSQLMKLSSELSALYPKGFGVELVDRGESLGKSIFDFVEKAKRDNSTILATIVGEDPAKTPEEVGVFVVDHGKITRKPKQPKKQEELI